MDDSALTAYEAIASAYDDFTHRNDYEMWFGALLPALEEHGLKKGRLLDVGCGTGRGFEPMLKRGWGIVGCDVSPAMLDRAKEKFGTAVPLCVADIRELPKFGEFELVWALNDVLNYLTEDGDLELALAGMRANLAPGGLILFDTSTLALFEASFGGRVDDAMTVGEVRWSGWAAEIKPGGTFEARVAGGGVSPHAHRQRHHTAEDIRLAVEAAGLELLVSLGQQDSADGLVLVEDPDERRDQKVIHIARV